MTITTTTTRECCGAPTPQAGRQGCCNCAHDADELDLNGAGITDNQALGKVDWEMIRAGRKGITCVEAAEAAGCGITPMQAARCLANLREAGYAVLLVEGQKWSEYVRYADRTHAVAA